MLSRFAKTGATAVMCAPREIGVAESRGPVFAFHHQFSGIAIICLGRDLTAKHEDTESPRFTISTYDNCLFFLLADAYRLDMIVNGQVVVELKAIEKTLPVHRAQVLTYLKLTKMGVGLLLRVEPSDL